MSVNDVENLPAGIGDMHLKNWSLIYPDRQNAKLPPTYDFVSTIPYIEDKKTALKYSRTKYPGELRTDELKHLSVC